MKYKPSNGTEGMSFMDKFCDRCLFGDDCDILGDTMVYDVDDNKYPKEWICDFVKGEGFKNPRCTKFMQKD